VLMNASKLSEIMRKCMHQRNFVFAMVKNR